MRIISNYSDYYDIGLQYGVDPNVLYVRDERTLPSIPDSNYHDLSNVFSDLFVANPNTFHHIGSVYFSGIVFEANVIGFCGKLYPYFWVNILGIEPVFIYNSKQLNNFMLALPRQFKKEKEEFFRPKTSQVHSVKKLIERFDKVFSNSGKSYTETDNFFIEHNTPIFQINWYNRFSEVYIDTELKSKQFAKIIDPYTAFQEISMYMSNTLANPYSNTDMENISDLSMRDKKGFHDMSFKKYPE